MSDSAVGHGLDLVALTLGGLFGLAKLEQLGVPSGLLTFVFFASLPAYLVVTVHLLGGTLGQRLFGVRVVSWEGAGLSWGQSFRRAAAQTGVVALLMVTGPFGFLWLLFNRRRNGRWWHDAKANTRLVRS